MPKRFRSQRLLHADRTLFRAATTDTEQQSRLRDALADGKGNRTWMRIAAICGYAHGGAAQSAAKLLGLWIAPTEAAPGKRLRGRPPAPKPPVAAAPPPPPLPPNAKRPIGRPRKVRVPVYDVSDL